MSKGYVNLAGAVAGWALGGPVGAFLANAGIGFVDLYISKSVARLPVCNIVAFLSSVCFS